MVQDSIPQEPPDKNGVLSKPLVVAILPSFRSRKHILGVIEKIGPEVDRIIVVDDACPEKTGDHVEANSVDPRVTVLRHKENLGVGGAMVTGYREALAVGAQVAVKIDSDGQMDPAFVLPLISPLLAGKADYAKGNRFYDPEGVAQMPASRIIGNARLSFLTKLSSGYWSIFDPTNGYTAIERSALTLLPLNKLSKRYFFESDMLFRLNTIRAVVIDVPMVAVYGDEKSNLRIGPALIEFSWKNFLTMCKRFLYSYFLRDFGLASVNLVLGILLMAFGFVFGAAHWYMSYTSGEPATAGTVMVSALPLILGVQLVLTFLSYDFQSVPRVPLSTLTLPKRDEAKV